jgi:hypothetical protein
MPLLVQDPLNALRYTTGDALDPANWAAVPGKPIPVVGRTYDSMEVGATCEYRGAPDVQFAAPAAAVWAMHDFHPDQYAEAAHGPFAWGGAFRQTAGIAVRYDPASDTCYVAYLIYSVDEGGANGPVLQVCRVKNGVATQLYLGTLPMFVHSDDWWFFQIRAWGQNPVNLQVITKAPTQYVLDGHTPVELPDFPDARYLHEGQTFQHSGSAPGPFPGYHMLPSDLSPYFVAPSNDGVVLATAPGAITSTGRAWIVWEGQDSHADRILSGQPGMRWGTTQNQLALFTAGELVERLVANPPEVSGGTATLSGWRVADAAVAVSCPTASVGAVSYPTSTTWECVLSDLDPGSNPYIVASGTDEVTGEVLAPPGPRTIRVEAGGAPVLATVVPGADLGPLAGAASFAAPSLSAAPPLPTMAAKGAMQLDVSATVTLPPMAGAGAMAAPEFLSPETGHRIRVVAGGAAVVVNVVPGADLGGMSAQGGAGAVALSAEVPLASMAGAGAMATPSLGLGLPSFAGVGALVQPSFSAEVALPTMAGKGAMRTLTIKFPGPPDVAMSRWRRPRAWVHGRHW